MAVENVRVTKPLKTEIKDHWERVTEIGCMISSNSQVEIHHCKSGSMSKLGIHTTLSKKNSDWLVIPLAYLFHRGVHGIHQVGVETWENTHGPQIAFLQYLSNEVGYDVFEKAGYYFNKESCRYEKS